MSWRAAFRTAISASSLLVRALLLVNVVACGNSDQAAGSAPQSQGGADSNGAGGNAESDAGDSGAGGSAEADMGGGGAGATGTGPGGADAGARIPGALCFSDSDCDDGLYCNGVELCLPLFAGSDAKVCMGPEYGPCGPSACYEAEKTCDCSDPDHDGDGFKIAPCVTDDAKSDCDDFDKHRWPGNPEVCDDQDQDCDDRTYGTKDDDHDGFFDKNCSNKLQYQPLFSTSQTPLTNSGTDCDDGNPSVHPGAPEVCDNLDNNCNGEFDEVSGGQGDPHTFYKDNDGDLWGSDKDPLGTLCNSPPVGYSVQHGDCNDNDPRVNPGREEICNGVDDDCNGTVDQPGNPGELMFGQPYDGITEFECTGVSGWKVKTCPPDRLDCNQKYLDACETIGSTLCNCHACGKTCAFSCGDTDCEEISALSTGDTHTCAVVSDTTSMNGKVACWGRNALGQLGDGTTKDSATPVLVGDLSGVSAIALGQRHSCAIASHSSIFCWGNNQSGQLGAGSVQVQSPYPLQVKPPISWGVPTSLASGRNHVCAIFAPGLLACWGLDDSGQTGDGSEGPERFSFEPEQVLREVAGENSNILDATQVVAGESHSCVLASGKVECWGDNSYGQLGENPDSVATRPLARPVPGLEGVVVDAIAAGAFHTCARSGTAVYCWGDNSYGELAEADQTLFSATQIALPANAVSITAGRFFGCALGSDGIARCWGSNEYGQRASVEADPGIAPTPIHLPNITGLFGGDGRQLCAVTNDDKTWCWGRDDFGQLGNGTLSSDPQPTPSQVKPLKNGQSCNF